MSHLSYLIKYCLNNMEAGFHRDWPGTGAFWWEISVWRGSGKKKSWRHVPPVLFPGKVHELCWCVEMSDFRCCLNPLEYFADALVCWKSISFSNQTKFGSFVLVVETATNQTIDPWIKIPLFLVPWNLWDSCPWGLAFACAAAGRGTIMARYLLSPWVLKWLVQKEAS